jgi:hypothetical protein
MARLSRKQSEQSDGTFDGGLIFGSGDGRVGGFFGLFFVVVVMTATVVVVVVVAGISGWWGGLCVGDGSSMRVEDFVLVGVGCSDEETVRIVGEARCFPGEAAKGHAAEHDGNGPDVGRSGVVLGVVVNFWREVRVGADDACDEVSKKFDQFSSLLSLTSRQHDLILEGISKHHSATKIDQLHNPLIVNHNVVELEISMRQTHAVKV